MYENFEFLEIKVEYRLSVLLEFSLGEISISFGFRLLRVDVFFVGLSLEEIYFLYNICILKYRKVILGI